MTIPNRSWFHRKPQQQSEMQQPRKNTVVRARSLLDPTQQKIMYALTKQNRVSSSPTTTSTEDLTSFSSSSRDDDIQIISTSSPCRRHKLPQSSDCDRPSILYESSYSLDDSSSTYSEYSPSSFSSGHDSLLIESSFSSHTAGASSAASVFSHKQVAFSQNGAEIRYFSRTNSELQVMRQFRAEERERRRQLRKRQLQRSSQPEFTTIFQQLFTDILSLVHTEDDDESSVESTSSLPNQKHDDVQPWFPFQCGVPVQCSAPNV